MNISINKDLLASAKNYAKLTGRTITGYIAYLIVKDKISDLKASNNVMQLCISLSKESREKAIKNSLKRKVSISNYISNLIITDLECLN